MESATTCIQVRCQTIGTYVATRPISTACQEGEQRRGLMPRMWWWEQPVSLDAINVIGSDASDGHLVAFTATDA
jgi:hypothetical protein